MRFCAQSTWLSFRTDLTDSDFVDSLRRCELMNAMTEANDADGRRTALGDNGRRTFG